MRRVVAMEFVTFGVIEFVRRHVLINNKFKLDSKDQTFLLSFLKFKKYLLYIYFSYIILLNKN